MSERIPLVFACSGCSNAGQLAGQVALQLDRRGVAEMSCLAGIGAAKPLFLKKLRDREVWVIDGCPINVHIRLHDLGINKKSEPPTGTDFDELIESVLLQVKQQQVA